MPQPRFDSTPGKPANRTRRYRWLTSPSHQLTWWLGESFPDLIPLLYVTGYPKSGTTWLAYMVADYFGLPLPLMSVFPVGCPSVIRGHLRVRKPNSLGCYAMRDGRDVMVSLYFHLTRSIPEGDHPKLSRRQRLMFPGLTNKENVQENLPGFMEQHFKRPLRTSSRLHWGQHVDWYFDESSQSLLLVRYEHLLERPEEVMASVIEGLSDRPTNDRQLAATIEKFTFQNQSGRAPGDEDRDSYFRNGESGDWQKYFTRDAAKIFNAHCGAALIRAGYEADASWTDRAASEISGDRKDASLRAVTN